MIYRFIIVFCLFSCLATAQSSVTQHWEYITKDKIDEIEISVRNGQTFVPFLNIEINVRLLDSLGKLGIVHDSILTLYNERKFKNLPQPIVNNVYGNSVLFKEYFAIKINDCQYDVYSFLIDTTGEINEHDCFELYYTPSIGSVAIFHIKINEWNLFQKWDRYLLRGIKKKKKSTITHDVLNELIIKILEHCHCKL